MGPVFLNNVSTRLTAALAAAATTCSVSTGDGALFASATTTNWIPATLVRMSGGAEIAWEEVYVTGRSADTLTIVRAREGSTALDLPAYYTLVSVRHTAGNVPPLNDVGATLTPLLVSAGGGAPTYTTNTGYYDIVNGWCRFQVDIELATLGTLAAGALTIGDLPATSHASYGRVASAVYTSALNSTAVTQITARVQPGSNVITLTKFAAGTRSTLNVADITDTSIICVSGHFKIA